MGRRFRNAFGEVQSRIKSGLLCALYRVCPAETCVVSVAAAAADTVANDADDAEDAPVGCHELVHRLVGSQFHLVYCR